jgi:hypothetical protein
MERRVRGSDGEGATTRERRQRRRPRAAAAAAASWRGGAGVVFLPVARVAFRRQRRPTETRGVGGVLGCVWFCSPSCPAKKLVAHRVVVSVWFVPKVLAANACPSLSLTDSCQKVGKTWAKDSLTKILAANSYQIFGRANMGINQTHP